MAICLAHSVGNLNRIGNSNSGIRMADIVIGQRGRGTTQKGGG